MAAIQLLMTAVRMSPARGFSMVGRTISHYQIVDRVGQGGMGDV